MCDGRSARWSLQLLFLSAVLFAQSFRHVNTLLRPISVALSGKSGRKSNEQNSLNRRKVDFRLVENWNKWRRQNNDTSKSVNGTEQFENEKTFTQNVNRTKASESGKVLTLKLKRTNIKSSTMGSAPEAYKVKDVQTWPVNPFQILSYDYLAQSSLRGIEVLPNFRYSKGESYLNRWWLMARKWGLIGDQLQEMVIVRPSPYEDFKAEYVSGEVNTFQPTSSSKDEPVAYVPNYYEGVEYPYMQLRESCENHRARVICIGDVHGCLEEVCELLRKVQYHPGDIVLFLGDLVAKGPYSVEVIRLAIDIDALSVRGNHDHEVVREGFNYYKQLGKYKVTAGQETKVKISDHLKIALQLSSKELKWLSQLPYYIKSSDLGMLFVHAGLQSGVRLVDQEPWVMMTMRSAFPGGRISHRCYYKYPWAESWAGPLTVLFGHDAARGVHFFYLYP
jgi:hypothetical protein